MSFTSSRRLVQEDIITELAKKSVIRVGCSSFADDENKNFEILTAVLRTTATLETLQLDDTAAALENNEFLIALAQNRTIRFLNLRCSGCDDGGATALAAVLKENSTLQTISLNDNNISDVGAKALAVALKENSSVEKIYLNDNNISDEGANALADALTLRGNGGSLQLISLRRNKLTAEGAETFTEALEEKKTRQRMHMDWDVAEEGRETELTEKTPKITSPVSKVESLASNQISDEGERATADTNILDRHQMEMDKLLAERKLMMQQLDNLSTARHEAQDELAAKDAMLKMKDEKPLTQRKQLDDYQREMDKVTVEQQRMRQQLEDKLFADNALAAAKDGELKIKSEEILNLRKQLDQKEAAKVLAETKVAEINAELSRNDDLIKMKDAELLRLQNQLSIQRNELETRIIIGQQQSKQLLDNLSAEIARVKAREASKDAELRMICDLLKSKDEVLLNQRKRVDAYKTEMNTKNADLKHKNEELLEQVSCNKKLRECSNEMKRRVEQLSAQNTQYVTTISSLTKSNDELSAETSRLSKQINSLNEKLKHSKGIEMVNLTDEIAQSTSKSAADSHEGKQYPSKRCNLSCANDRTLESTYPSRASDATRAAKRPKLRGNTADGNISPLRVYQKLKQGGKEGYPIIVTQGKSEYDAILLNCDHNPDDYLERFKDVQVKVRWQHAGFISYVHSNTVRLKQYDASPTIRNVISTRRRLLQSSEGEAGTIDAENEAPTQQPLASSEGIETEVPQIEEGGTDERDAGSWHQSKTAIDAFSNSESSLKMAVVEESREKNIAAKYYDLEKDNARLMQRNEDLSNERVQLMRQMSKLSSKNAQLRASNEELHTQNNQRARKRIKDLLTKRKQLTRHNGGNDDLDEYTKCCVCLEPYDVDPESPCEKRLPIKSTTCAHSLCEGCLDDYHASLVTGKSNVRYVRCPQCNDKTKKAFDIQNKVVDFFLREYMMRRSSK